MRFDHCYCVIRWCHLYSNMIGQLLQMLSAYPKRSDLWSVYLDYLAKYCEVEVVRSAYERVTSLSLPPKAMQQFFKKHVTFEEEHGDDETVEDVKRKAMEYVQKHTSM